MQQLQPETVKHYRPLTEFVPSHWHTSSILADDGTPIHYTRTGGANPSVVLLHGVQVSGLTWLRTAQALEATCAVIMPDFRGHGHSGRLTDGTSAEWMVNDIIALIKQLELENPFVVGHSMGADIAGRLAAVYPVRGLVLVDPALQNFAAAALMDADEPPAWMQTIYETLDSLKTLPQAERMVAGLNLMPPGRPIMNEVDYVAFVDGQAQFDRSLYRHMLKLGYLFEETDVIARIACPILLLTARPMLPGVNIDAGVAAFTQNWRDGQHIHFDDSGHAIMFDQLDRFIKVITTFFEAH